MTGALVILAAMIVIGTVLYLYDLFYYRKKHPEVVQKTKEPASEENAEGSATSTLSGSGKPVVTVSDPSSEPEVCCGAHTVCEKTNLSPLTGEIVYYDDEELDRFRGREAEDYTPEEVEEFRDVLMTLLPEDVAGWSRSIQVREINLPTEIREELIMIVSELRSVPQ